MNPAPRPDAMLFDLAIVVPVYRNAPTLPALAARLRAALDAGQIDYRLVLIVDASPDDAWSVVEALAAADPRVAGVLLARNVGQHAAVLAGLARARARWFGVMDADLQDPPELVPVLLKRARETGRTVFGRREGRHQGWGRTLTSRLFKRALQRLTGVPADVGTFYIVDAAVAEAMRSCAVRSPQVVVLAHHFSRAWDTVGFARDRRPTGRSAYSPLGRVRAAVRSIRCGLECRRLASRGGAPRAPASPVARVVNL